MGANVYGVVGADGGLLHPTALASADGACARLVKSCVRRGKAPPPGGRCLRNEFKLCKLEGLATSQANRVASARRPGRRLYGNGLKHSYYWTAGQIANASLAHADAAGVPAVGDLSLRDASRFPAPFEPFPAAAVVHYPLAATQLMFEALDGFNMESFFGFNTATPPCAARGEAAPGGGCAYGTEAPPREFWAANVRVAIHAASRRFAALLKVGQAGWKSVAQEHQPDADLHAWVSAYWATFLMAVRDPSDPLALGVHPFRRTAAGAVEPWLHPLLALDVGFPAETAAVEAGYRVAGHLSYRRAFERGVALYNPTDLADVDVPLGGVYADPFDGGCGALERLTLPPKAGAVLFALDGLGPPPPRSALAPASGAVLAAAAAALYRRRRAPPTLAKDAWWGKGP